MLDIDECITTKCHSDAVCSNTPGSYSCDCKQNYEGNGIDDCHCASGFVIKDGDCVGESSLSFLQQYLVYI